jgi:CTP:molybdopterin cytidylyltransferase MocA
MGKVMSVDFAMAIATADAHDGPDEPNHTPRHVADTIRGLVKEVVALRAKTVNSLEPTKEEVDAFREAFNDGWEQGESRSVRRGLRAVFALRAEAVVA